GGSPQARRRRLQPHTADAVRQGAVPEVAGVDALTPLAFTEGLEWSAAVGLTGGAGVPSHPPDRSRRTRTFSGETTMSSPRKTAIVTGASQGIGAGVVRAFVERGYNVVATSRKVTQSAEVAASDRVALVDGHIGEPATAARVVEAALSRFRSIDVLVN